MKKNDVSVLVTGSELVGKGLRSYDAVFRELLTQSNEEIMIVAFNITRGAEDVLEALESRLKCGVVIKLVVNRFDGLKPVIRKLLLRLASDYSHFQLFDFITRRSQSLMHAKSVVFDRKTAVVGSANLSYNGLVANHEIAVMIEGPAVNEVIDAIERLLSSKRSIHLK